MLTDVLQWLQGLPQPALIGVTGILVFAECTIGIGFIAPGEGGLLIAATTVTSVPHFLILWSVVTMCAALGDFVGYVIGRRFGPALRETRGIQKRVAAWDKATAILRRRGVWAVFLARFLPVVRTLIPAAAGTSGLPYRQFLLATSCGAACWSALHIGIGAALGEAAKRAESTLSHGILMHVGVAVLIAVIVTMIRKHRRVKKSAIDPAVEAGEPLPASSPPLTTPGDRAAGVSR